MGDVAVQVPQILGLWLLKGADRAELAVARLLQHVAVATLVRQVRVRPFSIDELQIGRGELDDASALLALEQLRELAEEAYYQYREQDKKRREEIMRQREEKLREENTRKQEEKRRKENTQKQKKTRKLQKKQK